MAAFRALVAVEGSPAASLEVGGTLMVAARWCQAHRVMPTIHFLRRSRAFDGAPEGRIAGGVRDGEDVTTWGRRTDDGRRKSDWREQIDGERQWYLPDIPYDSTASAILRLSIDTRCV